MAELGDCRLYRSLIRGRVLTRKRFLGQSYQLTIVMGKRKLAPDDDVIDLTGPSWHGSGSNSAGASGPPRQQASQTSLSKAKRPRKDPQSSNVSLPEKRVAILKKSCPKNILERVARVMSQR